MYKKTCLGLFLFLCGTSMASDRFIEIDISEQRLYLYKNKSLEASYPISTSKYGEGSIKNSYKTPLGEHVIKEMIGDNVPINTIFKSRIDTKRTADITHEKIDTPNDYVTSRILWLDGLEPGVNKGKGIDSFSRYIYIHATQEEGLIGLKASDGCIRMFNADVIELYDLVKIGTKVTIKA